MVEKICRLCFKKATRPIGIFAARGVKLNVAQILRLHFPDEVIEGDILPKFLCLNCWTKSSDFHEFYNVVDEAKCIYLSNSVEEQVPDFVQVECNSFVYDDDIHTVKIEPMTFDDDINRVEPPHHANSANEIRNSIAVKIANVNGIQYEITNDKLKSDANLTTKLADPIVSDVLSTAAAAELASKIYEKTCKSAKMDFLRLVPNYFDMNCEKCNYKFTALHKVYSHYRDQHKQTEIHVKCCQRPIYALDIRDHILHHLNPDLFKCNECGKNFTVGRLSKLHKQTHKPKTLECDICKKTFASKKNIRKHIMNSHGRNKGRFECNACKRRFNSKETLNQHVLKEHQNVRHVCHECGKKYRTWQGLQEHFERQHNAAKQRNFKCEFCPSKFQFARSLRAHMIKFHEKKTGLPASFQCPQCPKVKHSRSALKCHIVNVHTRKYDDRHKCQLCGRTFKVSYEINRHMKLHGTVDLLTCPICPKQYHGKEYVSAHMRKCHPAEWSAFQKNIQPKD